MNKERDIKLDIVIDIALDNVISMAQKYITDENGRKYEMSRVHILEHVVKECHKLLQKEIDKLRNEQGR